MKKIISPKQKAAIALEAVKEVIGQQRETEVSPWGSDYPSSFIEGFGDGLSLFIHLFLLISPFKDKIKVKQIIIGT
jgi:hypothetical protein